MASPSTAPPPNRGNDAECDGPGALFWNRVAKLGIPAMAAVLGVAVLALSVRTNREIDHAVSERKQALDREAAAQQRLERGPNWLVLPTTPTEQLGKEGDYALDTVTGMMYTKTSTGWSALSSLRGKNGVQWYAGDEEPTLGNRAAVGDFFFNSKSGLVYLRDPVQWENLTELRGVHWFGGQGLDPEKTPAVQDSARENDLYVDLQSGAVLQLRAVVVDGQATLAWRHVLDLHGSTWLRGTTSPPPEGLGYVGDFYIDTKKNNLFQKVRSASSDGEEIVAWSEVGNMQGAAGARMFTGAHAPTDRHPPEAVGGDRFMNTLTNDVYQKSTTLGSWSRLGSLRGTGWLVGTTAPAAAGATTTPTATRVQQARAGTLHLDTTTGTVYTKDTDAEDSPWTNRASYRGPTITWFSGSGSPPGAANKAAVVNAPVGSWYVDVSTHDAYQRVDDTGTASTDWTFRFNTSGKTGRTGDPGTTLTVGHTEPSGTPATGYDYHLNANTTDLHRYDAVHTKSWLPQGRLRAPGAFLLNGTTLAKSSQTGRVRRGDLGYAPSTGLHTVGANGHFQALAMYPSGFRPLVPDSETSTTRLHTENPSYGPTLLHRLSKATDSVPRSLLVSRGSALDTSQESGVVLRTKLDKKGQDGTAVGTVSLGLPAASPPLAWFSMFTRGTNKAFYDASLACTTFSGVYRNQTTYTTTVSVQKSSLKSNGIPVLELDAVKLLTQGVRNIFVHVRGAQRMAVALEPALSANTSAELVTALTGIRVTLLGSPKKWMPATKSSGTVTLPGGLSNSDANRLDGYVRPHYDGTTWKLSVLFFT